METFGNVGDGRTWMYYAVEGEMQLPVKLAAYDFVVNVLEEFY